MADAQGGDGALERGASPGVLRVSGEDVSRMRDELLFDGLTRAIS